MLLLLLLMLTRCGDDRAAMDPAATDDAAVAPTTETPVMPATNASVGVSGLDAYLAGSDAAPRTFAFERVNFDTGSSTIRPQDRPEIAAVAAVLSRYPNAKIRLYGYADARGSDAANRTLAQARGRHRPFRPNGSRRGCPPYRGAFRRGNQPRRQQRHRRRTG